MLLPPSPPIGAAAARAPGLPRGGATWRRPWLQRWRGAYAGPSGPLRLVRLHGVQVGRLEPAGISLRGWPGPGGHEGGPGRAAVCAPELTRRVREGPCGRCEVGGRGRLCFGAVSRVLHRRSFSGPPGELRTLQRERFGAGPHPGLPQRAANPGPGPAPASRGHQQR